MLTLSSSATALCASVSTRRTPRRATRPAVLGKAGCQRASVGMRAQMASDAEGDGAVALREIGGATLPVERPTRECAVAEPF